MKPSWQYFPNDAFTVGNQTSESEGQLVNYYSELSSTNSIGVSIVKGINLRSEYTQAFAVTRRFGNVTNLKFLYHDPRCNLYSRRK